MNAPVDAAAPEMTGETSLMLRRTFAADIDAVFTALTDPKAWMHWFGAKMATPSHAEADLRPGGKWAINMSGNETNQEFNLRGEFVEIDAPNMVSFTWAWESSPDDVSMVTYKLSASGDGSTSLVLTHERLSSTEARDSHGYGWMATIDTLADYLSG
ncbi:MAG: SRPBCC domain-containing protein [Pseudomonadota bacterium]